EQRPPSPGPGRGAADAVETQGRLGSLGLERHVRPPWGPPFWTVPGANATDCSTDCGSRLRPERAEATGCRGRAGASARESGRAACDLRAPAPESEWRPEARGRAADLGASGRPRRMMDAVG